jgi:hypothetical protein
VGGWGEGERSKRKRRWLQLPRASAGRWYLPLARRASEAKRAREKEVTGVGRWRARPLLPPARERRLLASVVGVPPPVLVSFCARFARAGGLGRILTFLLLRTLRRVVHAALHKVLQRRLVNLLGPRELLSQPRHGSGDEREDSFGYCRCHSFADAAHSPPHRRQASRHGAHNPAATWCPISGRGGRRA